MVHSSGNKGARYGLRALQTVVFGAWGVLLLGIVVAGSVLHYADAAGLTAAEAVQLLEALGLL